MNLNWNIFLFSFLTEFRLACNSFIAPKITAKRKFSLKKPPPIVATVVVIVVFVIIIIIITRLFFLTFFASFTWFFLPDCCWCHTCSHTHTPSNSHTKIAQVLVSGLWSLSFCRHCIWHELFRPLSNLHSISGQSLNFFSTSSSIHPKVEIISHLNVRDFDWNF